MVGWACRRGGGRWRWLAVKMAVTLALVGVGWRWVAVKLALGGGKIGVGWRLHWR